jgi:hypothetical protein
MTPMIVRLLHCFPSLISLLVSGNFNVLNRGVRLKRTLIDLKSFISKQEDLLYGRLNGRWWSHFITGMRRLVHTLAWVHELEEHKESRVNKQWKQSKFCFRYIQIMPYSIIKGYMFFFIVRISRIFSFSIASSDN